MSKIIFFGYKIFLFFCWYFNYIFYGLDWLKYYNCEFYNFNGMIYLDGLYEFINVE